MKQKFFSKIKIYIFSVCLFSFATSSLAFFNQIQQQFNAVYGFINNYSFVNGYMYTRGIYYQEVDGELFPVYVVYDEQGKEISEIGVVANGSDFEGSQVISNAEYNSYLKQYKDYIARFHALNGADLDPVILTRDEYFDQLSRLETNETPSRAWQGNEETHRLKPTTHSVLVLPEQMLVSPSTQFLLLEFPIKVVAAASIDDSWQTAILSAQGELLEKSNHRIGLRAVYYEKLKSKADDPDRFDAGHSFSYLVNNSDDEFKLTNPVAGVTVESGLGFLGADATNNEGRYSMVVRGEPCPLFSYQLEVPLEAKIPYRSFNPERAGSVHYNLAKNIYISCSGYGPLQTTPVIRSDFPIDVNVISGTLAFPSVDWVLPTEYPSLEYDFKDPETAASGIANRFSKTTSEFYDFDLDGQQEVIVCGTLDADQLFTPVPETTNDCSAATVQGIYLSASTNRPYLCPDEPLSTQCQPQFTRLIDTEKVQQDIGLVTRMSTEKVQDTDLFIVRKATGQLVSMRQGLRDSEEVYLGSPYFSGTANFIDGQTTSDTKVNFRMLMRGSESEFSRHNGGYFKNFENLQQTSNMSPEFYQRSESDHIRAGETLELWAINRATGYIGSKEIVIGLDQLKNGMLDTFVNEIPMLPPNIKVWAERNYAIEQGLDAGQTAHFIVGNEGVAEAGDASIALNIAWYDQDGRAIPDALTDYGFTGRLAYVSDENELTDAAQTGHARFAITPGTHVEVVKLPSSDQGFSNEHYYLQINALPVAEFNDFAISAETDELDNRSADIDFEGVARNYHRPSQFVPFKTPQFNEEMSTLQKQAYLVEFNRRKGEGLTTDDLSEPPLIYDWYYRPDYQFSVYDLELEQIQLVTFNADTGDRINYSTEAGYDEDDYNLLKTDDNFISPSSVVDIIYQLEELEQSPLQNFDGGQTLVLALGQRETEITFTENQNFIFSDLDFFSKLGSEDYLTLAIYTNEDSANLLYQYAFESEGLLAYYNIPAVPNKETRMEQVDYTDPDRAEPYDAPIIRSLGGTRLKFAYLPPKAQDENGRFAELEPEHVHLTFTGSMGWLCKHQVGYLNEYEQEADCQLTLDGTELEMPAERKIEHSFQNEAPAEAWAFWWEPALETETGASGSAATEETTGRWENDLDIKLNMRIEYPGDVEEEQGLYILTRQLGPPEDEDDPLMQGDDVAMLESMLWHFGLSPQKPNSAISTNSGVEGARIGSFRSATRMTEDCTGNQLTEVDRRIYHPGWDECANGDGQVSTEIMVRRFKELNRVADSHYVFQTHLNASNGTVDNSFLQNLGRDWELYSVANHRFQEPEIDPEGDTVHFSEWVENAVAIWTDGFTDHIDRVPAEVYTEADHNTVLGIAGLTSGDETDREALLGNWIEEEASYHWGNNTKHYQPTAYRMVGGGADEHGSLSFSQLLYRKRFGSQPCAAHADAELNLYRPDDQVLTFVIHTASNASTGAGQALCEGGFHKAFVSATYRQDYADDTAAFAGEAATINDLVGYRHADGDIVQRPASEDDYDLLSKAIAGYNGADGWLGVYSFAKLIKYGIFQHNSSRNGDGICHSCRYAIQAKRETFGDHLRTYIWRGGTIPAQIPDPDFEGDGDAPMIDNPDPNAGQAWCFAYSEEDWVDYSIVDGNVVLGPRFEQIAQDASPVNEDNDPQTPVGQINCETGANFR